MKRTTNFDQVLELRMQGILTPVLVWCLVIRAFKSSYIWRDRRWHWSTTVGWKSLPAAKQKLKDGRYLSETRKQM